MPDSNPRSTLGRLARSGATPVVAAALGAAGLATAALATGPAAALGAAIGVLAIASFALVIVYRLDRRPPSSVSTTNVDGFARSVTDAAVAGALRRFDEPWLRPYPGGFAGGSRVLLLPGATYHLAQIGPLADEMESRGHEIVVCVGDAHFTRTRPGLFWFDRPTHRLPGPDDLAGVTAIVTMKDWAGYRPLILAAKERGILTVGIVEGAQDFTDTHQPTAHEPYRTADLILCQGPNDAAALTDRETVVVGSARLEHIWNTPIVEPIRDLAVINVNFTYGVLTDERDDWVSGAIAACDEARMPWVLSVHPAARVPASWRNVTRLPITLMLPEASLLISRFSTVPYEALARGVEFAYHNPHGEQLPAFAEPMGAYRITRTTSELVDAIRARRSRDEVRSAASRFLSAQVDIDPARSSAQRAADAIEAALADRS